MDIQIKNKKDTESGWKFSVDVVDSSFTVSLEKDYWRKLTDENISPEDLIKKSFEFLIERESVSAILKKFNLKVINKYFPKYEEEIKKIN